MMVLQYSSVGNPYFGIVVITCQCRAGGEKTELVRPVATIYMVLPMRGVAAQCVKCKI